MTSCTLLLISAAGLGNLPDSVLLDFTATWCGPCRQMTPTVNRLIQEGLPVRKIDVDRHPDLVRKFGVRGFPTFVLVVNGKVVDRSVGYTSEGKLRRMIARIPKTDVAANEPRSKTNAKEAIDSGGRPGRGQSPPLAERPGRRFQLPVAARHEESKPAHTEFPEGTGDERPVIRANLDVSARDDDGESPGASDRTKPAKPMDASVRIRVRSGDGINYGSGTVISSRRGKSIVLTCGHIFRGVGRDARIEVDVFDGTRHAGYDGRVLTYDLKADVGLLEIATPDRIPVVPVADSSEGPGKGDRGFSIGCGGGSKPSKMDVRVTALNRYIGPDNIECTGVPKQGRSGGGLFDGQGRLVGVCFAADPPGGCGLYAGLRPIHQLLDKAGVKLKPVASSSDLVDRFPARREAVVPEELREPPVRIDQKQLGLMQVSLAGEPATEAARGSRASGAQPFPIELGGSVEDFHARESARRERDATATPDSRGTGPERTPAASSDSRPRPAGLNAVDQVFGSGEAEVVCIIRPLGNPQAASQVVVINRASSKFVRYLRNELASQPQTTAKFLSNEDLARVVADVRSGNASSDNRIGDVARDDEEQLTTPFRPVGSRPIATPASRTLESSTSVPQSGRYRRSPAAR